MQSVLLQITWQIIWHGCVMFICQCHLLIFDTNLDTCISSVLHIHKYIIFQLNCVCVCVFALVCQGLEPDQWPAGPAGRGHKGEAGDPGKGTRKRSKSTAAACQQPARCLNTPLWLDRSFSQRFCDYSNHKKKKASFPWKRSSRKLQRNLHLNSRNQQRFRVKGRNCSFRLSALVFKGRVMYIKSMPCFRGFIN